MEIVVTSNADTPIARGQEPLLALDLWEHAYYLDHRGRREDYVWGVFSRWRIGSLRKLISSGSAISAGLARRRISRNKKLKEE